MRHNQVSKRGGEQEMEDDGGWEPKPKPRPIVCGLEEILLHPPFHRSSSPSPGFQCFSRIKIPGNSPGDTNPAYARLPAWRAGPAGTHLELGFPAGLRSEML